MITNIPIGCPGCGNGVRLRISIGHEDAQPFYFICPHCDSALRAVLMSDQGAGVVQGLEIEGRPARLVADADATVNIFTDLPVDPIPASMEEAGGSPFIMHFQLLGETFTQWQQARETFLQVVDHNWSDVVRWWGFYLRRDWTRFDEHAQRYWSDDWPSEPTAVARHDAIHRALDVILVPLFPGGEYARWKMAIQHRDRDASWIVTKTFARAWVRDRDVVRAQQELVDVLDEFVQLRWALLPGLLLSAYDLAGIDVDPSWRITRDDFSRVRAFYGSTFELSHAYLPTVMAFSNALDRGNPEHFPDQTSRSLSRVEALRSVDRERLLASFKPWGLEVRDLLDRRLRNSIAHATARHDLHAGVIQGPNVSTTYARFVERAALALQVPLLCLGIIKLMLIVDASE